MHTTDRNVTSGGSSCSWALVRVHFECGHMYMYMIGLETSDLLKVT